MPRVKSAPLLDQPSTWEAPDVEIGDIVLWHHDSGEAASCLAIVTRVNGPRVSLSRLEHNFYNLLPIDGVRHADDPDKSQFHDPEVGVWSHRPAHLALLERLAVLEKAIQQVTK